jgi:hypothetical protein
MMALLLFQALACLLSPAPPFAHQWAEGPGKYLTESQWNSLQTLTGDDLWLGYDNGGWLTTGDERGRYRLVGDDYEVWLFFSATRQQYDILPFANTTLFADANGDHYGMHPCGGWAIDAPIIDAILGKGG